ncbi:hypothetical protein CDAR_216411 [Caerostris darwini]|uniref:Uncharacterized protein n=1 Tax=Caerostris darwini TaxID=1538125 RepID=A0AAV4UBB8_9ARAC|nr:hypothetical protein CDAR_216411 [Caerostris darwini]
MTEFDTRPPEELRVTQCIIIISSVSSAPSRKQCPSVAGQQSYSWMGNQMMKSSHPFCKVCSHRSFLLIAQTVLSAQSSLLFRGPEVREKVFSNAI